MARDLFYVLDRDRSVLVQAAGSLRRAHDIVARERLIWPDHTLLIVKLVEADQVDRGAPQHG